MRSTPYPTQLADASPQLGCRVATQAETSRPNAKRRQRPESASRACRANSRNVPSGSSLTVSPAVDTRDARARRPGATGRAGGDRARSSKPPKIPMLDLFAGAGGLSTGLRQAGFEPVAAIELMPAAARTYSKAHGVPVIESRVRDADLDSFRGEVQVVVGGPPCQPWSTGGLRLGEEDDRDGFPEFFEALRVIKPRAFLIENVAGLGAGVTRQYFVALLEALATLGYKVQSRVLNAADYGVPQHRHRRFIVGLRDGGFSFPAPTHGPKARHPWVPAGAVLDMEPAGEPNLSVVTYAKNPHLRPSPYDGLLFNGGGRPIDLSAPARTVLASAGGNKTPFIDTEGIVPPYHEGLWKHYKSHGSKGLARKVRSGVVAGARRITVAESAALQSFDRGLAFDGTRSTQYTLVGNAVPPKLARAVGRRFAASVRASFAV